MLNVSGLVAQAILCSSDRQKNDVISNAYRFSIESIRKVLEASFGKLLLSYHPSIERKSNEYKVKIDLSPVHEARVAEYLVRESAAKTTASISRVVSATPHHTLTPV